MKADDRLTLADLPFLLVERYPKPACVNRCLENGFEELSSRQFYERVRDFSFALTGLGLRPGDRMAIISESRPEWTIADLACLTAGGVSVPVYPTQSSDQARFILDQAGVTIAVVSTPAQVQKVRDVADRLPGLKVVVLIEGQAPIGAIPIVPMSEMFASGRARLESEPGIEDRYRDAAAAIPRDALATIVYTSGTTGEPKGVMLSHGNIMSNVLASNQALAAGPDDVTLTFLPLSHVFERMVIYRYLQNGCTIYYAESLNTVARDLVRVRPTIMTGVPRVYEKFYATIYEKATEGSAIKRALFLWAVNVGLQRARAVLAGETPPFGVRLRAAVADRVVFSQVRSRVGGRLRFLVSGSAPLARHIGEFFYAVGLPIIEGYGLTETSPALTSNPVDRPKFGTVGVPMSNVEIRIGDYGEILARGPNVMSGYYKRPDLSAEVLKDGWFYTGDIGEIDKDGYLTITDRKKDLIVTSGGKKIAPQPLENQLKTDPLIAEVVIVGEQRRFPAALVVPNFATLDARARLLGLAGLERAELVKHQEVLKLYQAALDRVNEHLAQFERIKRFALLPTEFTMERGELTPTMKVRRKVVEDRWKSLIDAIYET